MDEEIGFQRYCPNCNYQVMLRKVTSYSITKRLNYNDENQTTYFLFKCCNCGAPFLLRGGVSKALLSFGDFTSEVEHEFDDEWLYPEVGEFSVSETPKNVQKAYKEAVSCYQAGTYSASLSMSRKCLEALCFEKGLTGKNNLEEKLDSLGEEKIIDSRLLSWAHLLRKAGNAALHDVEKKITKQDARDALDFVEAIISYVFFMDKKLEAFTIRVNRESKS